MSDMKPITVYTHASGPNPKKVLIILEELDIPYKAITVDNPKTPEFVKINPNGRLPAIEDPNTDITLWESAAIVEYLVENYNKENKLTFTTLREKTLLKQYSYFQMSGQGPYFGQGAWYSVFDKNNPAARERYAEQTERVIKVLDDILKDKEYLVGNTLTYADILFFPWNHVAVSGVSGAWNDKSPAKYPFFWEWHQRLLERPSVKKVYGL